MVTEETSGVLFEYPETEPETVVFDNVQTVIDHYHSTMSDNEGLIEVNTGKTNNGRAYIYVIFKRDENDDDAGPSSVIYKIKLDVTNGQNNPNN